MSALPDDPPLPAVQTAMLDPETLADLFRDIDQAGVLLGVLVKGRAEGYAEKESPTLARAREFLAARAVRGIQIRYRVASVSWCDTLMRTPDGVRLVRMEIP